MSPDDEAALAQRRWIILRVGGGVLSLLLAALGFAFIGPLGSVPAGIVLIAVAIALQIVLAFVATPLANRGLTSTQVLSGGDSWWYNHKTGAVEHGPQSLGSDRDGRMPPNRMLRGLPRSLARRREVGRRGLTPWNGPNDGCGSSWSCS